MRSQTRSPRYRRSLGLLTLSTLTATLLVAEVGQAAPEGDDSNVRYTRKSKKSKAQSGLLDTKFKEEKQKIERERERGVQMMDGQEFGKKRQAVEQEMAAMQIEYLKR